MNFMYCSKPRRTIDLKEWGVQPIDELYWEKTPSRVRPGISTSTYTFKSCKFWRFGDIRPHYSYVSRRSLVHIITNLFFQSLRVYLLNSYVKTFIALVGLSVRRPEMSSTPKPRPITWQRQRCVMCQIFKTLFRTGASNWSGVLQYNCYDYT